MTKQATELSYAVRFRVIFKYFGQMCLVLAALTLVPLVMSVFFGDTTNSLQYSLVISGLAALWGCKPQPSEKAQEEPHVKK